MMLVRMSVLMGMSVGVVVSVLVLFSVDLELGRRHAGPQDSRGRHGPEIHRQAAECRAQLVERQPEIEQRADDHVARGP